MARGSNTSKEAGQKDKLPWTKDCRLPGKSSEGGPEVRATECLTPEATPIHTQGPTCSWPGLRPARSLVHVCRTLQGLASALLCLGLPDPLHMCRHYPLVGLGTLCRPSGLGFLNSFGIPKRRPSVEAVGGLGFHGVGEGLQDPRGSKKQRFGVAG